jgi:hypothetical protein
MLGGIPPERAGLDTRAKCSKEVVALKSVGERVTGDVRKQLNIDKVFRKGSLNRESDRLEEDLQGGVTTSRPIWIFVT